MQKILSLGFKFVLKITSMTLLLKFVSFLSSSSDVLRNDAKKRSPFRPFSIFIGDDLCTPLICLINLADKGVQVLHLSTVTNEQS